jgi:hypothetical protein
MKRDILMMETLSEAVNFVVQEIIKSCGQLPSYVNWGNREIHFCHNQPTIIPLLCASIQLFPHNRNNLIGALELLGETVWQTGFTESCSNSELIGNGYFMHSIHRLFVWMIQNLYQNNKQTSHLYEARAALWLTRAWLYGKASYDKKLEEINEENSKGDEACGGWFDHVYSLLDGHAGSISLLSDLFS